MREAKCSCVEAFKWVNSASERQTKFRVQTDERALSGWLPLLQLSGNDKHYSNLMDGRVADHGLWCRFIFSLKPQHQSDHSLDDLGRECVLSKSPTAPTNNKARVWISIGPWPGGGMERWRQAGRRRALMRGGEIEGWREWGERWRGQPSEISEGREWEMEYESESRWRYFT